MKPQTKTPAPVSGTSMAADLVDSLPASIRIGPADYQFAIWNMPRNSSDAYADINHQFLTLGICRDAASPIIILDALIHEVTHGIIWAYALDIPRDDEERVTRVLGTAWAQIYRDNTWLTGWIAQAVG